MAIVLPLDDYSSWGYVLNHVKILTTNNILDLIKRQIKHNVLCNTSHSPWMVLTTR